MTTSNCIDKREGGRNRRWGKVLGVSALALVLLGGASVVAASRLGHGGFHRGTFDPESAKEHLEFASGFLLSKVDATDEQESEVAAILDGTVDDLSWMVAEHRAGREAFHQELVKPSVDREALEAIRAEQVARMDEASRRIVTALADVADVLSQEQRQELAATVERHHGG